MGSGRASPGNWHRITRDNTWGGVLIVKHCDSVVITTFYEYVLSIFSVSPHNNGLKVGIIIIFLFKMRELGLSVVKKWPSQGHINKSGTVRI